MTPDHCDGHSKALGQTAAIASKWTGEVIILKISVLVDLVTPVVTGRNNKCGLIQQRTLVEQLLSQNYNRKAAAAKIDQEQRNSRAEERVMIMDCWIEWQQIVFSSLKGSKCDTAMSAGYWSVDYGVNFPSELLLKCIKMY